MNALTNMLLMASNVQLTGRAADTFADVNMIANYCLTPGIIAIISSVCAKKGFYISFLYSGDSVQMVMVNFVFAAKNFLSFINFHVNLGFLEFDPVRQQCYRIKVVIVTKPKPPPCKPCGCDRPPCRHCECGIYYG